MVQVVAHRGSSAAVAEHTLGAYELAISEGADALECDVRLTRDGVLVCVHDRRIDRTSSGTGKVSSLHLDEMSGLDFASWKQRASDPELAAAWDEAEVDVERNQVLTLERLVQLAAASRGPSGRPIEVHVETKHPTRHGGLTERALVSLLQRHGMAARQEDGWSPVTVMSYATTSLRRVHQLAPTLPTVLLMERVPVRLRDGRLPPRVAAAGPSLDVLRAHPRYVDRVHRHGGRVHCYTADTESDIRYLLALGVEAIISNHPGRVRRLLQDRVPR